MPNYETYAFGFRIELFKPAEGYEEMSFWLEERYVGALGTINKDRIDFLKTDLGLDINVGKRLFFLYGGGFSFVFVTDFSDYYTESRIKGFSISARGNIGLGFFFSKQYCYKVYFYYKQGINTNI